MYETADAHRVVEWCKKTSPARHDDLMEVMFRRYFQDGVDLTSQEVLLQLVDEVGGLDRRSYENMLKGSDMMEEVKQGVDKARQLGVDGVPFFIIEPASNNKEQRPIAFSGAQPPDVIKGVLEKMSVA